jgi:hypothetical protein
MPDGTEAAEMVLIKRTNSREPATTPRSDGDDLMEDKLPPRSGRISFADEHGEKLENWHMLKNTHYAITQQNSWMSDDGYGGGKPASCCCTVS